MADTWPEASMFILAAVLLSGSMSGDVPRLPQLAPGWGAPAAVLHLNTGSAKARQAASLSVANSPANEFTRACHDVFSRAAASFRAPGRVASVRLHLPSGASPVLKNIADLLARRI